MKDNVHILVVDDDATEVMLLRRMLERSKYIVDTAVNGKEGLKKALKKTPDLIISDVMMPVMDGYELCRQVKKDKKLRGIPFVIISVLSEPQDIINVISCGADDFIPKPFERAVIFEKVTASLKNESSDVSQEPVEITAGVEDSIRMLRTQPQKIINIMLTSYKCSIRKNDQLEKTNKKLYKALETIRTLKGLIPICSSCKKIRDDEGYWQNVEEYITVHSNAQVQEGLCPVCMREKYPEMYDEKEKADNKEGSE